ncbi:phospholipase C, phosphocholine-specific [Burkholderia stagnalis]|uniref:phosphocholine-specific phospholipase C n=1 Tax=Burkholderia stagnalis TaxID=1503054 RepID=UPI000752A8DB|nr:phospholipase C, phosphocholine-specific [Burkholderia stagnalis]AOK57627.1 phospholipase C, phosphocholine-specific [Burkholderia stagnalis]KVN84710.1 phospholipase C, phosphocholine-specific [Burkholderia stagnalis]KWO27263.1 phospholipase C, phosphocholine-specific [Burkholderia stagnalis]KWO29379.1 phospholipase C, phosphocholine-specific [Burkholderia stagnalis]MDY7804840.1 phospholipase C, phosphocholine-specific [Burkholderia stagnalis]
MPRLDRRTFLIRSAQAAGASALAAAVPESIRRALAVEPARVTGTIRDVQHIVVLMQENRAFDHYFGTFPGVRGFNDPRAVARPDGKAIWYQNYKGRDYVPWHLDTSKTWAQWMTSEYHDWDPFHQLWNEGRNDKWMAVQWPEAMGYFKRTDLPYYYPLANAFTICDAYHQSMMGPTNPNRLYLMTGRASPNPDGSQVATSNFMGDRTGTVSWTTFPERLQQAGIDWRIYQEGGVGSYRDVWNVVSSRYWIDNTNNFDCNALAWFAQFKSAPTSSPLYQRGMTARGIASLRDDVLADRLPQVSWIVPPFSSSEHPWWGPSFGEEFVSRILDALTSNPAVWAKTVFLLCYDEGDGFYDHVTAPVPPWKAGKGLSTVSVEGEIEQQSGLPIGLGTRVPLIAISPWSKGGWTCSEVFDHTSVIRFIEKRFVDDHPGVYETNITPWRRAVCGDLSSAFDFAGDADAAVPSALLDLTATKAQLDNAYWVQYYLAKPSYPAGYPAENAPLPVQEPGQRKLRPVPYELFVEAALDVRAGVLNVSFANNGKALPGNAAGTSAAVFHVHDALAQNGPRFYTIQNGRVLSDQWWPVRDTQGRYDLAAYGPNGFYRRFKGGATASAALLDVSVAYRADGGLVVRMRNAGNARLTATITDNGYGVAPRAGAIEPGATVETVWNLAGSGGWYDLSVTVDADADYLRALAGHVETGAASITDPLFARVTGSAA